MKLLTTSITLLLCLCVVSSWSLEEDDPAIVGVWLFEGDVKDASGNGNDGKIVGNFKFEDGKFGKAVVAGGGGSIDVADSKSIQSVSEELTVAAWFRVDADSDTGVRKNGAYLLEDQSGGEPIPDGFSFRVWTTNGITPGFYGKTELEQGKWHHVAGTYDGKMSRCTLTANPKVKKARCPLTKQIGNQSGVARSPRVRYCSSNSGQSRLRVVLTKLSFLVAPLRRMRFSSS